MSSIAMSSSAPGNSRSVDWRRFAPVGLGAVVAAGTANGLVSVIGSSLVADDQRVADMATIGRSIVISLIPATVAVLLYAILLRVSDNPAHVFTTIAGVIVATIVAAAVFTLTLLPDFTYTASQPSAAGGTTAILVLMHLVASGVIFWLMTTFTRPESREWEPDPMDRRGECTVFTLGGNDVDCRVRRTTMERHGDAA